MQSFAFIYQVRLDDLDFMGIVGNAQWLIFLERARADLLNQLDYSITRMQKEQLGGVVSELSIRFLKPARFNDRVQIKISADQSTEIGGRLLYEVTDAAGLPFVRASTTMIFVNSNGRPTRIPNELRERLFPKAEAQP